MAAPEYSMARFLNVRSASGASFSPDGNRVSFISNISGIAQVWSVDVQGGWPEQLTFHEDRVAFAQYSPTDDRLVFGMDAGGNERLQLYLLSGDGSLVQPLTAEPDVIHTWGGWSPDGRQIAFASNSRDRSYFDVYVQNVDTGARRCVYQADAMHGVAGWSPDGRQLVVSRSYGTSNNDLYLVEIESGPARHLTPHQGEAQYAGIRWRGDMSGFYLVSDQGREHLGLAFFDLERHAMEWLETPGWDVEPGVTDTRSLLAGMALSPDERWLAFTTNVDGYSKLTVREVESGRDLDLPGLPPGVVTGLVWSPDGGTLAFMVIGSRYNPDVWLLDAAKGTARHLTISSTAGIPREVFVEPELVRYPAFDQREVPAFYYQPRQPAPEGGYACVVYVHGGPESQYRPDFQPPIQYLVHRGYAVLATNVRGSTGYGRAYAHLDDVRLRMDSVRDLESAVQWLKESGRAHPERIAVMGGSYGGFMVLSAVTTYPGLWAAGIDFFGIANFETFLENTGPWRRRLRELEYGSLEADGEFLREISPIRHVDRITAPMLVAQGLNDPRVPPIESEQIVEQLRKRGIPTEYVTFQDEGHGFTRLQNRIAAYTAVADFLDAHLGAGAASAAAG